MRCGVHLSSLLRAYDLTRKHLMDCKYHAGPSGPVDVDD